MNTAMLLEILTVTVSLSTNRTLKRFDLLVLLKVLDIFGDRLVSE